ncbi:MAG: DNA polymerase III subunit delta [Muribaculaceae bacterium]|nr:DNA polymerase III subunit delta [Muribaculaceae bacterium]
MAAAPSITFDTLKRQLSAGQYAPVYLLHGEEGYYIDELVKLFERILPEDEREYSLTNIYAPQVADVKEITDICRSLPMLSERQVVIVREAQNVRADFIDKLAPYAAAPAPSTILVVASRGEKIKGRAFVKAVKASGVVYESPKVWPNEIPNLAAAYIRSKGMTAGEKSAELLAEYVGTSLSRLYNEIDKLAGILGRGAMVTPEAIEMHVGISKDYNNYELVDALAVRDAAKAMRIVKYFAANPKANPFVTTTSTLFGFFADLMQGWYTPDRSDRGLQASLGLNPYNSFALRRIRSGMKSYNPYQVIEILDVLRRYDAASKGVGSRMNPYDGLADAVFHILTAPGRLPV